MSFPRQTQFDRSTLNQNTSTSATSSTVTNIQRAVPQPQVLNGSITLPEDIAFQIMYWTMLKEASSYGHIALCFTSKEFSKTGQNFQNSVLNKDAHSILIHKRLIENTRSYLDSLGYRPLYESPKDTNALNSSLKCISTTNSAQMVYLSLNENIKEAFSDPDYLQAFRNYQPESLPFCVSLNTSSTQIVSAIAKALPRKTNLNLEINVQNNPDGEKFAKLLKAACSVARITSIKIVVDDDLLINQVARNALLDVLCGGGAMSHVSLGYVNQADQFLEDLAARFKELRYMRLLTLYCVNTPANPVLESLVSAMKQRQALGLPNVTIVLNEFMTLSANEKNRLEELGLFIGDFDGSESSVPLIERIRRSVGEGPVSEVPVSEWNRNEEDSSDDSIVVVVDNEDESSADSEFDYDDMEERETSAFQNPEDQVRLVNRKQDRKKDNCSIS